MIFAVGVTTGHRRDRCPTEEVVGRRRVGAVGLTIFGPIIMLFLLLLPLYDGQNDLYGKPTRGLCE